MWSREKAAEEDDMIWLDLIWLILQQNLRMEKGREISWFDLMPWFDALIDCWFGGAGSRICCFFIYLGMGWDVFLGKKEMEEGKGGIVAQDAQRMGAIEKI
jgi:hypothetical protein